MINRTFVKTCIFLLLFLISCVEKKPSKYREDVNNITINAYYNGGKWDNVLIKALNDLAQKLQTELNIHNLKIVPKTELSDLNENDPLMTTYIVFLTTDRSYEQVDTDRYNKYKNYTGSPFLIFMRPGLNAKLMKTAEFKLNSNLEPEKSVTIYFHKNGLADSNFNEHQISNLAEEIKRRNYK
jgi:hypothetical protein